ncbi:MAG: Uma2 family endonuclease [Acidobacteriota bacterium]|nr:Uma2 family endonuclease [Acidobacteriota bacterium]
MATATHSLSLEEFRCRYADEKPYYEYWFGEAIQKSVPTTLHGLLQQILCALLNMAGYRAGSEIELRIDPEWQPKPDVIASRAPFDLPYPSHPVDIVAEVLSPDDKMAKVFEKCRQYQRIGIGQIFVLDPESKIVWEWSVETQNLERVSTLELKNGQNIQASEIWSKLDQMLGG